MRESTEDNSSSRNPESSSSITRNSRQFMSIMDGIKSPSSQRNLYMKSIGELPISKKSVSRVSTNVTVSSTGTISTGNILDVESSSSADKESIHHVGRKGGISKSFKNKKSYLGVKPDQEAQSPAASSAHISSNELKDAKEDGEEELDEDEF